MSAMTGEQAVQIMQQAVDRVHRMGFDVWGWDDGTIQVYTPDGNKGGVVEPRMLRGKP